MKHIFLIGFLMIMTDISWGIGVQSQKNPPPSEDVFKTSVEKTDSGAEIIFDIDKGFYIYKERISISVNGETISPKLPTGFVKNDPVFNKKMEVYPFDFSIDIDSSIEKDDTITIEHQGCAEKQAFCYTPRTDEFTI